MKNFTLISIFILSLSLSAQKGVIFPSIKGITLNDKNITVPTKNDKYSVIAIAYNRSAEDDLKKWLNPLFDSFIKVEDSGSNTTFDMADVYDVNFVFIPMIAGFRRVADEFKKGTDKQFWQYIMDTEKTDVKVLQETLDVQDTKVPYFYVLDESGKVVEVQSGKFTAEKLEKLEAAVQ